MPEQSFAPRVRLGCKAPRGASPCARKRRPGLLDGQHPGASASRDAAVSRGAIPALHTTSRRRGRHEIIRSAARPASGVAAARGGVNAVLLHDNLAGILDAVAAAAARPRATPGPTTQRATIPPSRLAAADEDLVGVDAVETNIADREAQPAPDRNHSPQGRPAAHTERAT